MQSVLNQNCSDLEYLVIDGGSSDNSVDVIKRYSNRLAYWVSEKDNGQTQAINKGIKKSTGEIIAYICSDDYYETDIFKYVADLFEEDPELSMIYGSCTFVDAENRKLRFKKSEEYDPRELLVKNIIWQPTVFLRRHVFDRIGLFNEELHYGMDLEFWLRVAKAGLKVRNVDRNLAYYRWQENSKTVANERKQLSEGYEIIRSFGGGGAYSYFLHHFYWPNTSRMKRFLLRILARTNQ